MLAVKTYSPTKTHTPNFSHPTPSTQAIIFSTGNIQTQTALRSQTLGTWATGVLDRSAGIEAFPGQRGSATAKIWQRTGQPWRCIFGIYSYVRVHKTLGTTPAVAAGVELERWRLERVVEMTADYLRPKEDSKFEEAFAAPGI